MSSRHGQGVATWLIMLPLLIVPLIAVFGVPQFTPISTQTADGADGGDPDLQVEFGDSALLGEAVPPFPTDSIEASPASSSQPAPERWSDPFQNPSEWTTDGDSGTTPASPNSARSPGDPFNQPQEPVSRTPPDDLWTRPEPEPPRSDSGIDGYSRRRDPRQISSNTPPSLDPAVQLTWREAVARLNKLGVQKFQLSQTDEPYVFQFVCDLSRPDNPRVTHRFEAKAGEPLKAVENVIQQVESWSAQQASR